jgi:hypothetical protein
VIAQAALVLALVAGVGAFGAGLYLKGRSDGRAIEQATDQREREIARMAADTAAAAAASAISTIKVQNRTVYSEVQREITERPVYRDCLHTEEQLRRINDALTGVQSQRPDGSTPAPASSPIGNSGAHSGP